MLQKNPNFKILLSTFTLLFVTFTLEVAAIEIPTQIKNQIKQELPNAKFRLDNSLENGNQLWLSIIPRAYARSPESFNGMSLDFKRRTKDNELLFSNGFLFIPVADNSIKSLSAYDLEVQDQLLSGTIAQEFFVPKGFTLPRDLALIAGRLPIEIRNIKLATEKELEFRKKLAETEEIYKQKYLIYSNQTNQLAVLAPDRENANGFELSNLDLTEDLGFISAIKPHMNSFYLMDYSNNKLKSLDLKKNQITDIYDFDNFIEKLDIKDFVSIEGADIAYLFSAKKSSVYVFDLKKKNSIKTVKVPSSTRHLMSVIKNPNEQDELMFYSTAPKKLYRLSSFSYTLFAQKNLEELLKSKKFIPVDLNVHETKILLAVKFYKNSSSKLLILDSISYELLDQIDFPESIIQFEISKDKKNIYLLMANRKDEVKLVKMRLEDRSQQVIELDPDLNASQKFYLTEGENFAFVSNITNKVLAIVDLQKGELVKKLELGFGIDYLLPIKK